MAQARTTSSSRLGAVRSGPMLHALRHLYYGPEGVGKSTLASNAPSPIVFDCEGGADRLDIDRYCFRDDDYGHVPKTLGEFYSGIEDLRVSDHGYKTLIVDTVGSLEALVWDRVCEDYSGVKGGVNKTGRKLTSIEDFGFAKGYGCAIDEWRRIVHVLDCLRLEKGMTIVLLGHSVIRTFKNPISDDYDRIQIALHDKAAGLLKKWSDIIGYCCFEDGVAKEDERSRPKGYSTGRRLILLERTASYDAKSRVPMPAKLEMDSGDSWAPLEAAIAKGRSMTADDLLTAITVELERIGDGELTAKVNTACEKSKAETATLSRYLNTLKQRAQKETE